MSRFQIRRADGRSNQQVIIDHVKDRNPGTTFTYEELASILTIEGRPVNRSAVCQAVLIANQRLLREHKRELRNLRGRGYKLAHAREHRELAGIRTRKSDRQLKKALNTMENARLEEMTPQERDLHIAQCSVNTLLYMEQRRIRLREKMHEDLIARLTARVDQVEARQESGNNPEGS